MCSWEQSLNDDFDWLKHNDSDSFEYLGPDTDHTMNNPDGKISESISPSRFPSPYPFPFLSLSLYLSLEHFFNFLLFIFLSYWC